ncbi:MAG: leucine-rich repeat protein, partial [Clostridia bacterium]|nr:leucine-rich repeat protein [Clostridia bacterium]
IGSTDSDGRFGTSDLKWQGVPPETITISKNLKFIWDFAFQLSSVRKFFVSEDNPYFTSDNGVLFTKSKYTLIQYPGAHTATKYTIPPETKIIAHQAFYSCVYLEELTIGAGVNTIDSPNWGKGYLDSKPSDMSFANTISGGFDRIYQALTGDKTINIHEDNSTYSKINGIIYILHDDETVSLLFASKNIKEANLPDNVILIEGLAFRDCISLTQIVLPAKIVELRSYAFANCVKLTDVYFMGDIPEIWRTDIFFGTSPALTLHYSVNSKSDWTSPTWLAPDGLTYNTQPYTPETPPEAEDTVIYGDADRNGIFDDPDILLLNQYFAGHNVSIDMTAADIDDDNQVTRAEAMYLARALAGWPGYILPQVGN